MILIEWKMDLKVKMAFDLGYSVEYDGKMMVSQG